MKRSLILAIMATVVLVSFLGSEEISAQATGSFSFPQPVAGSGAPGDTGIQIPVLYTASEELCGFSFAMDMDTAYLSWHSPPYGCVDVEGAVLGDSVGDPSTYFIWSPYGFDDGGFTLGCIPDMVCNNTIPAESEGDTLFYMIIDVSPHAIPGDTTLLCIRESHGIRNEMTGNISGVILPEIGCCKFVISSPKGYIAGTVTDLKNSQPIGGAVVSADADSTFTDSSGHYFIELIPGRYVVKTSALGYHPGTAHNILVAANESTMVDFKLSPIGSGSFSFLQPLAGCGDPGDTAVHIPVLYQVTDSLCGFSFAMNIDTSYLSWHNPPYGCVDLRNTVLGSLGPPDSFFIWSAYGFEDGGLTIGCIPSLTCATSIPSETNEAILFCVVVDVKPGTQIGDTTILRIETSHGIDNEMTGKYSGRIIPELMYGDFYIAVQLINEDYPLPNRYSLLQNYPNPFNAGTAIKYAIPRAGRVTLEIYNIYGQKVAILVDEYQRVGHYLAQWNGINYEGKAVASGIYLYRLKTDNYSCWKRMILLK